MLFCCALYLMSSNVEKLCVSEPKSYFLAEDKFLKLSGFRVAVNSCSIKEIVDTSMPQQLLSAVHRGIQNSYMNSYHPLKTSREEYCNRCKAQDT